MKQHKAHQLLKMLLVMSIVSSCVHGAPKTVENLKLFNYHKELKISCRLIKDSDYEMQDGNIFMQDSQGHEYECSDWRNKKNKLISNAEINRLHTWINVLYSNCKKWKKNTSKITTHLEIKNFSEAK